MGALKEACASAQYSFFSFLLGPTGDTPGKFPQSRATYGARSAFAVWLAAALSFVKLGPQQAAWVGTIATTNVAVLQPMIIQKDLGTSIATIVGFSFGASVFLAIGTAVAALAWLVGGMHFYDWVLFAFITVSVFLAVWLTNIPPLIPPKRIFIFANDSLAWAIALPMITFIGKGSAVPNLEPLVQTFVSLLVWFWAASGIAFFATILPFGLGALPGWRSVPSYLASTMQGLGGYASAIAMGRCNLQNPHPRIDSRALLRHWVLHSSASLRQFFMRAMLERFGGFYGQSPKLLEVARGAEVCRLALILQHAADLQPRSAGIQSAFYSGAFHESTQELQRITAQTLHAAASLTANLAGHDPPKTELAGYPWSGPAYIDERECRKLSVECAASAHRFADEWADWSRQGKFADTLVRKAVSSGRKPTTEEIMQSSPLLEICTAEASIVGALSAAQAAARAAAASADYGEEMAENDAKCCMGVFTPCFGGIGILHWLSIPWAGPKVWWQALLKSWRFALRLSITLGILTVILIVVPFPESDPGHGMWAIMAAGVLATPTQGAGLLKSLRRLIAGIAGSILALMVVLIAQWDFAGIWVWMGVLAFVVKFFEPELQYAGISTFFTFSTIISKSLIYPNDISKTVEAGCWRVGETLIAVVVVGLVGTFIAPSRATPKVRSSEMEALSCSATACAAVSRALSAAIPTKAQESLHTAGLGAASLLSGVEASPEDEEGRGVDGGQSEQQAAGGNRLLNRDEDEQQSSARQPSFDDLRTSAWAQTQQFFFGGDGRPGIGDTLTDARWESYVGTDAGHELFGGILWVPTLYCHLCLDSALAPGRNCLDAVVDVSSLTRATLVLVSLLQSGFQGGGKVLLADPRVDEALGPHGEGLAEAVQATVASLAPLLTVDAVEQGGLTRKLLHHHASEDDDEEFHSGLSAREQAVMSARARLSEAQRRFHLLMVGAHAARAKEGGAIMVPSEGSDFGGSTHRITASLFLFHATLEKLQDIINKLAGDRFSSETSDGYAIVPGSGSL